MSNLGQTQNQSLAINSGILARQKIGSLLEEAWDLRKTASFEDYSQLIEQVEQLSNTVNYEVGNAACLILRSQKNSGPKEILNAIADLQEIESIIESEAPTIWRFRLYLCLAELYLDLNQIERSLEYALIQLNLAQELNNDVYAAAATLNIGRLHSILNNENNALTYFSNAEALFSKVDDSWGVIITLINQCTFYRERDDWKTCRPIAQKCMQIAVETDNSAGLCFTHIELGFCDVHYKNYDSAKEHFETSLTLALNLKHEISIIESYLQLALIPDDTSYKTKFEYLEKAIQLTHKLDNQHLLSECYKILAEFHKQHSEYKLAYDALEQHMQLEHDLNKRTLDNALLVFETEKAQQEAEVHRLRSLELQSTVNELEELNKKVRELSIRDALTGLYNRRHFEDQIQPLFAQALRYEKDFSVCLLDIDHFKGINDQFSHQIGDIVLQTFAKILDETIRSADILARYGGEEFIILMPETSLENAHQLAERLRMEVENFDWEEIGPNLKVRASFGVSSKDRDTEILGLDKIHPEQLISLADKRLYIAKESGRNQVCSSHPPLPT